MDLQGKIALVTGATRGIGRAIAQELAQQGVIVVGTATSEAGAQSITEALQEQGGRGVVLDVTDAEACSALVEALGKEGGGPHILVNNAGITRDNLAMRMKDDDWSAVIDTNLAAVFRLSRALARELGSRGITVNCVAPGFIETDMTRALDDAQTAALLGQIPLGRLGSPADVAHAVSFLASQQAGYITGTTLHVNGGMYMQ